MKQITIYNRENAIRFLDYAQIAKAERIKVIVEQMLSDQGFALGLCDDERPVGFIVAFKRDEKNWQCDAPFFVKGVSNKKDMKQLIAGVITAVKKRQADGLYFRFMERDKTSKPILETFATFDFKPSGYTRKVFIIPKKEIEKFKVMVDRRYARYVTMTPKKTIKTFCALSNKEMQQLKAEKGIHYPDLFDPFLLKDIDFTLSRIIYIRGEPAAWVTYRVVGKTALYVDRFFIKERYRTHGLFFPLFYDTYMNTPQTINKLVLYINGDNKKMLRLFRIFKDCKKTEDTAIEWKKELKLER